MGNVGVPCDLWNLPECSQEHVQCEIREHKVNDEPAIMGANDPVSGALFYVDMACRNNLPDTDASNLACKVDKPDHFIDCGHAQTKRWETTQEVDLTALFDVNMHPKPHITGT